VLQCNMQKLFHKHSKSTHVGLFVQTYAALESGSPEKTAFVVVWISHSQQSQKIARKQNSSLVFKKNKDGNI